MTLTVDDTLQRIHDTLHAIDRAQQVRRLDQWEMHRVGDTILTPELAAWAVRTGRSIHLKGRDGYTRVVTNPVVFDVTMCRLHIECGDTFTKG